MKSFRTRTPQAPCYNTWLPSLMLLSLAVLLSFLPASLDLSSWRPDSSQTEQVESGSERSFPIFFEEHVGEGAETFYVTRGMHYTAVLHPEGMTLELPHRDAGPRNLRMVLESADPEVQLSGRGALPGKTNYLVGNDPGRWVTDLSNFSKVHYGDVYPAIDLVFYGNGRQLEYDFVVKPGGDPESIRFRFEGADFELDSRGNLFMTSEEGRLEILSPYIYQQVAGSLQAVAGEYAFGDDGSVGFRVDDYDSSQPLVIDPVLVYSTMLGGGFPDHGRAVAVDAAGNAYVGGVTGNDTIREIKFPTINALQDEQAGTDDAFITKFDAEGNVLFSTVFGGGGTDNLLGLELDHDSNIVITGWTDSDDLPTVNAFQSSKAGIVTTDAFVAKINSAGNQILFSTYLGGSLDERLSFNLFVEDPYGGVAVDPGGNIYVTGVTFSTNFPTKNAFQSAKLGTAFTYDLFLSKFNPNGGLVYSTYLGGTERDLPRDIAVDDSGSAYVAGGTFSTDFPLVAPLRSQSSGGDPAVFERTQTGEGFLARFNPAGNQLLYSSYLGGLGDDQVGGVALGDGGIVYLVWDTNSDDIPIVLPPEPVDAQPADSRLQQNPAPDLRLLRATRHGDLDLVLTVLDPSDNSISLSGYLGGSGADLSGRIALDDAGLVHVTGMTQSSDYPVYNPIQGLLPGARAGIVSALDPATTNAHYSTYLGSGGLGEYANDLATTNSSTLVTGRSNGGFTGFQSNLPLANPFARGRAFDQDAYATKLMFSRGQFLGPFAGQDWSRFVRLDTHANGVPDPLDEILSVYRNGSTISFSSARWSESLLQFSNTNPGNGEFETVTRSKAIRNRIGTPRGTLTTTADVTGRDGGRITSISLDQERVTSTTTNKSGQVALIDSDGDGVYDAFRGQGDGIPEVTVSLVPIDSDSDGRADFVTIPWGLAHLAGVNTIDRLPDPQVFVPLGDTDGDTIPDTVAFDFDVDNVADADLPSLARMAGPDSDPEYKLHFAHFGDGAGLVFSQIILFPLDPLSEANVTITIRDDDGQLLSIDLNGTVVNGQLQAVIPACGIRSFRTDGLGPVQGGSVTVSSDKPVAGVVLFGGSIGLAGVGSSQEMGNGFLAPMETNTAAGISTGLAVKNLDESALTFTFRLLDSDGVELASAQRVVGALGHLSLFLDQLFPSADLTDFVGVLRVEAQGRMTATVLQIRPGEFATMPVTPLGGGEGSLQFAHFGDGLGVLFSQFLVVNAHDKDAESLITMQADDGSPLTYDLNGEVISGTTSPFTIPVQGLRVFKTDGEGDLLAGSGSVSPNSRTRRLAGVILFGGSVGLAGVGSSPVFLQGFIAPIEADLSNAINTGVALRNTSFATLKLLFHLFDADGRLLATDSRSMPGFGHEALLVNEFDWVSEPGVTLDFNGFQGVIKVTPDGAQALGVGRGVTATVVQTRPGQFATMPVSAILH